MGRTNIWLQFVHMYHICEQLTNSSIAEINERYFWRRGGWTSSTGCWRGDHLWRAPATTSVWRTPPPSTSSSSLSGEPLQPPAHGGHHHHLPPPSPPLPPPESSTPGRCGSQIGHSLREQTPTGDGGFRSRAAAAPNVKGRGWRRRSGRCHARRRPRLEAVELGRNPQI